MAATEEQAIDLAYHELVKGMFNVALSDLLTINTMPTTVERIETNFRDKLLQAREVRDRLKAILKELP